MERSVYRYVRHSISLNPAAEQNMEEMECVSCKDTSGCGSLEVIQDWSLRHAGRTAHFNFRRITLNYYVVTRHEDDVPDHLRSSRSGQVEPSRKPLAPVQGEDSMGPFPRIS